MERPYLQNIFRKKLKKCQITTFKLFTGIKEALIMRISATNMHNLAVKRHKIVKVLLPIVPSAKLSPREILKFHGWAQPRNLIPAKIYPIEVIMWPIIKVNTGSKFTTAKIQSIYDSRVYGHTKCFVHLLKFTMFERISLKYQEKWSINNIIPSN